MPSNPFLVQLGPSVWPIDCILAERLVPTHQFMVEWHNTWETCINSVTNSLPPGFTSQWPHQVINTRTHHGQTEYEVAWQPTWVDARNVSEYDIARFKASLK